MKKSKTKIFKTFKEWSNDGYTINKGSKATWFGKTAKFSKDQVSKRFNNSRYSIWENYDSTDDDYDDEDWIGVWDFGDN